MNYSLRQLLLVSLLSATMVVWGVTAFSSYKATRDEVAELFDAELAQSGKVLLAFVDSLLLDGSLPDYWRQGRLAQGNSDPKFTETYQRKLAYQLWSEEKGLLLHSGKKQGLLADDLKDAGQGGLVLHGFDGSLKDHALSLKYERKVAFQLWSKNKGLLLRSESAPQVPFTFAKQGFSEVQSEGSLWHVFSVSSTTGDYVIHVGQQEAIRKQLTDEISEQLVMQFLVGMPVLALVIWLIIGNVLMPISQLQKALTRREVSYLKPLSVENLPNEIVPMVNALNSLFGQLEEAFEHERRFTADASHELRTPLAGLLTQVQVALKTQDEQIQRQALKRIEQAVNKMSYMVKQLLTFSRIDSGPEYLEKTTVKLSAEVIQVITDLEHEAYRKSIEVEFIDESSAEIVANPQLLNILIRNIIDNAIKYTPEYGSIKIYLTDKEKNVELRVEDSGPGIAPEAYEKSLKRFHRLAETASVAQGTGLGFSIVQRIVAIHGAEFSLGVSELDGLKVTVLFPLPRRKVDKTQPQKMGVSAPVKRVS
ncbi:ATP-binding protein [Methylomicrobium sp. Wu6]|uniref:ATP-binding protein n=1 Tax=Methylomicrobium sp. Wu6 TaxID=3107928 RepID=UPI002DD6A681|nr:ATP-binding protein [Methylomicrobium sp. Wu6]MEC4749111.1 ATP-binding protein [Methylomicrobium sp. Wu6]